MATKQKAVKVSSKKAPKQEEEKAPAGVGVIASIEEWLKKATKSNPVSKEEIVERLAKRFPDRSKEGMSKTVQVQLPGRMSRERGLNIIKTEDGYYVE